ncbi:hypothetical protein KJ612_14740 [Myxococcota bacterium]|nr:hypothetical protein [Myxococcota bacterium]MBU1409966.1 hypothetical protein [Myxococcota bacterium]
MKLCSLTLVCMMITGLVACAPALQDLTPAPEASGPAISLSSILVEPVGIAPPEEIVPEEVPGPVIGGTIDRRMIFPTYLWPQMGIFALQGSEDAPVVLGEFAGIPVYTANNDTFDYTLTLPQAPPREFLLPTADGLLMGRFITALYYDANNNGHWDPQEFIGGATRLPATLVYFAPDTLPAPPATGWSFIADSGEGLEVLPWDGLAQHQDVDITVAPVHWPVVRGTVSSELPDRLRVGVVIVDGRQFETHRDHDADPWRLLFDPALSYQVLTMGVINGEFMGTLANPLEYLDAATLEAWSLTRDIAPGVTIRYLPVMAFAYVDADGDRRLTEGDTLAAVPVAPEGERWTFTFVLDMPRTWGLMAPEAPFLHAGYNWWSESESGCDHDFLQDTTFFEWNVSIPMTPRH